mgnify:CR=1 FL=1
MSLMVVKADLYCSNNSFQIGYPGNHQQHNMGRECWPMDNAILWCDNIYWACKDSDSKFMIILEEDSFYSILPTATQYARNAIFAGMMPYMFIVILCLILMYIWPELTLWLPNYLYGK